MAREIYSVCCMFLATLSCVMGSANRTAWAAPKVTFETPHLGQNLGVWRLTHDPTVRDHANYHNTQCFSPDGRYVCYTHWEDGGGKNRATVHLVDLSTGADRQVDFGVFPRWAKHHNWLFYVSYKPRPDARAENGSCVMWLDLENDRLEMLVDGPEALGETDFRDRWLFGGLRNRRLVPQYKEVRIPIERNAELELLPDVVGAQRLPNPRHPLYFTRRDHNEDPFKATRFWYDLDGMNQRIAVPTIQKCHMCWLGNGQYMLLGNGLIRGRKWNQPFPSNINVLASVSVGDVSPCGTSGRYVCGDTHLADLRSGSGFQYIEPLSVVCYPATVADNSGIYDADPKGSADGTKICFVSNYDLEHAPATHLVHDVLPDDTRLVVDSTDGFPASGFVNVHREVIAFQRKTATSFEGITRQALGTRSFRLNAGRAVASFDARLLSDELYKKTQLSSAMVKSIVDRDSPLMRQRQTDVYVAVVRKPDAPHLQRRDNRLHIIPGEHHDETKHYHLFCDGERVASPVVPGESITLDRAGRLTAVAVEWSGLQSEPSLPLRLDPGRASLQVTALKRPPADFSWTSDEWSDGTKTVKQQRHLRDGIIRREWYDGDELTRRHDLDEQGNAIRRIEYRDNKIARREYFNDRQIRVSVEWLDPVGYVTETIRYDNEGQTVDHWWFERGWPVKQVRNGREYIKRGNRFGRFEGEAFIDTPRGALSE